MDLSPTWKIISVKNAETEAWWYHAKEFYNLYPDAVPEAIHPLFDPEWNETEVVATRGEVKDAQAWAIGISGGKTNYGGLAFKRL